MPMTQLSTLIEEWQRFDDAAHCAECRLALALDEYCDGNGPAPSPADIASAKRQRFIASHRLRWILHQIDRARADLALI